MTDINIRSFAWLGADLMRCMEATQIWLRLKTFLAIYFTNELKEIWLSINCFCCCISHLLQKKKFHWNAWFKQEHSALSWRLWRQNVLFYVFRKFNLHKTWKIPLLVMSLFCKYTRQKWLKTGVIFLQDKRRQFLILCIIFTIKT